MDKVVYTLYDDIWYKGGYILLWRSESLKGILYTTNRKIGYERILMNFINV